MQAVHRTQLYLQELQYQYLLQRAQSEHKSIAAIVRDLLDRIIHADTKKEADPIYKIIGLGRSGKKDLAVYHDRHIYKKANK